MTINILGISCYYHDSSAALIVNGEIMSAVQEERFSRIKNDSSFPTEVHEFLNDNVCIDCYKWSVLYHFLCTHTYT